MGFWALGKIKMLLYTSICLVVLVCSSCLLSDSVKHELSVMDYGAVADGRTLCTEAIQSAIDDCSRSGGRVVFPAGVYVTGTFYIKSGVELHLAKDAVILGSADIKHYTTDTGGIRYSTPWMDRCLIYAEGADNISITGEGTLNGNGSKENFPPGKGQADRPMLLRLFNCNNVLLRDFKMRDPASWGSAIIACENVEVRNLNIHNRSNWNGDGLDFDSCRNVIVDNCDINTSDDSICLQASEENRPCENIKITNCRLSSHWAAIRIGLLTRSEIRNVEMRDCHFYDIVGEGFKLQMAEGSIMENMLFENIGFDNVDITFPGGGTEETASRRDIPELGDRKPEYFGFNGDLPAYGFYIRHAKGITLKNVKLRFKGEENRPPIICDDVEDFSAPDLDAQCSEGVDSVVVLPSALTAQAEQRKVVMTKTAANRPNILLVLLDDLGFSDLGCYGGEIPTPNIDSLSRGGLSFTRMTNSARCCPSRASLLTGLHPGQAGIPNMGGELNDRCVTLAEVLGDSGYLTYGVGKWHVGAKQACPTERGFQEYYGYINGYAKDQWSQDAYMRLPEGRKPELQYDEEKFYATDVFTDYALEFIRQAENKEKPWFLYLAHSSPHFPIQAPMESARPMLDTYRRGWDILREERFARLKEIGLIDHDGWKLTDRSLVPVEKEPITNGYSGKPNPAWKSLSADRREDLAHRMAIYAAMVKHVDEGMGRIIEQLKAADCFENTVILILSDNGACYEWGPFGFDGASRKGITLLNKGDELDCMGGVGSNMSYGSAWANLCNTPFRLYKHFTHQGGIVTPFIVHWPTGVESPGRWVRDPAHIMDIMPTLVELAGAVYPGERNDKVILPMEGVSLLPVFKNGGDLAERTLCYQHAGARAIHKGDWKLVYGKRFPNTVEWELYDLRKDPCETVDLAKEYPDMVAELVAEYDAWAKRCIGFAKSSPVPDKRGKINRR